MLRSPVASERLEAASELANWHDKASVPAFVMTLYDDEGTVQTCQISISLGRIGDPAAIPALTHAVDHPSNLDLRVCAAHALGEI